jgi:hypothetical protein
VTGTTINILTKYLQNIFPNYCNLLTFQGLRITGVSVAFFPHIFIWLPVLNFPLIYQIINLRLFYKSTIALT